MNTTVVIRRHYSFLNDEQFKSCIGNKSVDIVVDRRFHERRTAMQPVMRDRRIADRRESDEEIIQLLISP